MRFFTTITVMFYFLCSYGGSSPMDDYVDLLKRKDYGAYVKTILQSQSKKRSNEFDKTVHLNHMINDSLRAVDIEIETRSKQGAANPKIYYLKVVSNEKRQELMYIRFQSQEEDLVKLNVYAFDKKDISDLFTLDNLSFNCSESDTRVFSPSFLNDINIGKTPESIQLIDENKASYNFTLKASAAIGLEILSHQGYELSNAQKSFIKDVKASREFIHICNSGLDSIRQRPIGVDNVASDVFFASKEYNNFTNLFPFESACSNKEIYGIWRSIDDGESYLILNSDCSLSFNLGRGEEGKAYINAAGEYVRYSYHTTKGNFRINIEDASQNKVLSTILPSQYTIYKSYLILNGLQDKTVFKKMNSLADLTSVDEK